MADHKWKPVGPCHDRSRARAAGPPAYAEWREAEKRLRAIDPARLKAIKQRLIRRMIVEIGLLESLYELDRDTTETLVTHGFAIEHLSPVSTNMEPARLIAMLKNQEAAILPMLEDASHPLTKDAIRQFHATAMQHQDIVTTTVASGQKMAVPLLKGAFKNAANDLTLPDGGIHEFCPPGLVEREIDTLLARLADHRDDDPVQVAAWLHYHLYQAHPFQTGNGRVVRAATTHLMLQAGLLPLVVEREDRAAYKAAMKIADGGDLMPLAALLARAESATIARALEEAGS